MVIALPMEAKSIIRHFNLELLSTSPFKVYANSKRDIRLVISGIGKVSAGAATAHLASVSGTDSATSWLNVGVAGHKSLPIGSIVAAHKITDVGSGQSWSLDHNLDPKIQTKPILTFDKETHNYPDDEVCEMESAGFYKSAIRFTSHKLVHCLKIISDNKQKTEINYGDVEKLIQQNMVTIKSVVRQILYISAEQAELNRMDSSKLTEKYGR